MHAPQPLRLLSCALVLALVLPATALAQAEPAAVAAVLGEEILPPDVALDQIRRHVTARVAPAPVATSAAAWATVANTTRERLLRDVVFHGWPAEWRDAPPRFEETGVVRGDGYRIRKLRYEIVPGFQGAALLYEPEHVDGRSPAILNVNGHVGPVGKAVEYKQKRCITFARHGILALSLEWLAFGELSAAGNSHWFGAHLDLVGTHELGLFYLAMRRGLDYLHADPRVDPARIGMTGLSGGGWQTIVLSALDERIKATAPVAGFNGMAAKAMARAYGDTGDVEQSPADFFVGLDYPHLAALLAPRPALLVYNAEDDCCFRAGMAKPVVFEPARAIYAASGRPDGLSWHENRDPGTHNYQLDNRQAVYRFFSREFRLPPFETDSPEAAREVRPYDELLVGLPSDNLTILDLARRLAAGLPRGSAPAAAQREGLARVVRYRAATIERAWTVAVTKHAGVETASLLFDTSEGLSANGVWLRAIPAAESAPATLVLADAGKAAATAAVVDRVNRGEQVLAVDLAFQGDAWKASAARLLLQNLSALGERPLGLEAAQLVATTRWLKARSGARPRLETNGIRSQVVGLVAAALEPGLFGELVVRDGMASLGRLLEQPVEYKDAPDLFCLDLYRETDLDRLAALAAPTRVR